MYTHHTFIQSSVDGHLSCYHNLVIVDAAAINIGVHPLACLNLLQNLKKKCSGLLCLSSQMEPNHFFENTNEYLV